MSRSPDPADDNDETPEPALRPFEPFQDLFGAVLMVPDSHWGFDNVTSNDHPGVCTAIEPNLLTGYLVKGTDADHVPYSRRHFVVDPTTENGLHKRTAFELEPRRVKMRRLKLYVPERRIGRLSGGILHELRAEIARLNPED